MPKLLLIAMAAAAASWFAVPERAAASDRDAVAGGVVQAREAVQTEVGARRKAKRYGKRSYKRSRTHVIVRPAHPTGRYVTPLIHPYDLYVYRRPYFVPGAPPFVRGIRRDGMGTAAYGFGAN